MTKPQCPIAKRLFFTSIRGWQIDFAEIVGVD